MSEPISHQFDAKKLFLESDPQDIRFMRDLAVDSRFKRCLSAAFAYWSSHLSPDDPTAGRQIRGVKDFMFKLNSMADPVMRQPARNPDHLNPVTDGLHPGSPESQH